MWPSQISRRSLDPHYALAEAGLRVNRPTWDQVSKSGGLWARTLAVSGHTCDRVPLAISPKRCVNAKWCHTGCIFGAKNSLITNYLPSAERLGVQIRPGYEVQSVRQSQARPYRYVVTATGAGRGVGGDRVQGPGALDGRDGQRADPHALAQRAAGAVRPGRQEPRRQRRPRRGDRVRPEEGPLAARPPGIPPLPRGQADHHDDLRLLGRAPRPPLRRHPLQPPGDLPLVADQLPLRRRTGPGGRSLVVGPAEEAGDRELGQSHRAAGHGRGHPRRPVLLDAPSGGAVRPNDGPVSVGTVHVRPVRAVDPGARGGQRGDEADRRAQGPGRAS